ncbi:hypothetical protein OnM2_029015 [Erysiphe neolycopersici]|uniref:Uncharacterized protein n=1 Tax=Erysiphe neolycopersici TaxID=212602 RepID=A0A420HZW8_9PEZI|nr:hypothetical protein OnM2_029015 [Erysiphe neolycopersici]
MSVNYGCSLSQNTMQLPLREIHQPRIIACEPSTKKIQRENSFTFNSNSSDEFPSPHASIYEAVHISANSSEDNGHKIELINIPPRKSKSFSKGRGNDENIRDVQTKLKTRSDDIGFLYGRGTILDTIAEQKSSTTMRTIARSKSVEDLGNSAFLRYKNSFDLPNGLHRKRSFSVDDVELIKRSYHEACIMIERKTPKLSSGHQIYAQPKIPIDAPPERPKTPPGMPSWTASQNLHIARLEESAIRNRLQRRHHLQISKSNQYSYLPQNSTTQVQSGTSQIRGFIAPRFRPPKSTYTSLNQHPFFNACLQKARPFTQSYENDSTDDVINIPLRSISQENHKKAARVRFTPSITARNAERMSHQSQRYPENVFVPRLGPKTNNLKSTALKSAHLRIENKISKPLCPHSKGRRVALKKRIMSDSSLRSSQNLCTAPLESYRDMVSSRSVSGLSVSPSMNSNNDYSHHVNSTRSASLSSSTALISSTRLPTTSDINVISSSNENFRFCWKCKLEHAFAKVDQIWIQATSCWCFSCCKFDIEENQHDETVFHNDADARSGYSRALRELVS